MLDLPGAVGPKLGLAGEGLELPEWPCPFAAAQPGTAFSCPDFFCGVNSGKSTLATWPGIDQPHKDLEAELSRQREEQGWRS